MLARVDTNLHNPTVVRVELACQESSFPSVCGRTDLSRVQAASGRTSPTHHTRSLTLSRIGLPVGTGLGSRRLERRRLTSHRK